jgi:hypothetical protein
MKIKKFKIKSYPGEKAINSGMAIGGAAAAASGAAVTWYSSAGLITKMGLAAGIINPPLGMFIVLGVGGAVLGLGFSRTQLLKKEKSEAKEFFKK